MRNVSAQVFLLVRPERNRLLGAPSEAAATPQSSGAVADTPLVAALTSGMWDHVRAFEQRLASFKSLEKKVVVGVVEAIGRSFNKHLEEEPVSRMTDKEMRKAVLDAVTTAAIQSNHGPVLNNGMKCSSKTRMTATH